MNNEQKRLIEKHYPAGGKEIAKLRRQFENRYVSLNWDTTLLANSLDREHKLLFS